MHWTPQEIRHRRLAKGWLQAEAARRVGVSRRAWTNWETGRARPRGENLEALEAVLGDAPVREPTLSGATDAEFMVEIGRRLGERAEFARRLAELEAFPDVPVDDGARLPTEDLAWPSRETRKGIHRKA